MIMKTKMKRKVEMIKISVEIKLDQSIIDMIINQLLLLTMSKTSYKTFQIQIGGREILKAFNKDQITKVSQTYNMQCKEEIHLSVNLILRSIMSKQQTFKILLTLLTKTACHVNSTSLPSPRILSNPSSLTMMNILKKSIHSYFIRLQEN